MSQSSIRLLDRVTTELLITNERADDVPLLLESMMRVQLPQILDKPLPKPWKHRELSWGWTATIGLSYILTEGGHRKSTVAEYIRLSPLDRVC
jgi:transposase